MACGLACIVLAFAPKAAYAEQTWLTGPALGKKLEQPVSVSWSGKPLREGLVELGRLHQVAVLLDRRVDPSQPLELSLDSVRLGDALHQIAASRDLGFTLLDGAAFVGPRHATARLRTLSVLRGEELARLPAAQRLAWSRARSWRWDDLAAPRELLEELAAEGGFKIEGLDAVPHDLWAGAELGPLSLADRLTLALAQFDLTFQADGKGERVVLEPIPDDLALERSYPGGRQAEELARQIAEALPGCQVRLSGGKVFVRGLWEDHERIRTGQWRREAAAGREVVVGETRIEQFQVKNVPLRGVLAQLGTQLKLEFRINEEQLAQAGRSLDERISVELRDATIEQLLERTLAPAGLAHRRNGNAVEVFPKGK